MLSKKSKYILLIVVSILVAILAWFLSKKHKHQMPITLGAVALVLIIGVLSIRRSEDKEKYDGGAEHRPMENSDPSSGCNQTINITQNCGKPSPIPPVPTPDLKEKILDWIKAVDSKLTVECQACVLENALKLWNMDTLNKTKGMDANSQKLVLNA